MLTARSGIRRRRICGGWRPTRRAPSAHPRALLSLSKGWRSMRSRKPAALRHAGGAAHAPSPADSDRVGARLQRARPRGAGLSPHRGPPPFCPHIEAELGVVIDAVRCAAAAPPIVGADPPPRWTLRRLAAWVRERFGLRRCRETIRAALCRLDLSWKKAKKLLGRADPDPSTSSGAARLRHAGGGPRPAPIGAKNCAAFAGTRVFSAEVHAGVV
jgi:hypothetical protein